MKCKSLLLLSLAFLCSCGDSKQVLDLSSIEKKWNASMSELQKKLIIQSASFFDTTTDLHGSLVKNDKSTPISFFFRDENLQCAYGAKFSKRFHIRMKSGEFQLFEMNNGKPSNFPNNKISKTIADSDLSFEDIRMGLGKWKNVTIICDESIAGQACHKLRIINHHPTGDYKIIYAWVHKKHGNLFKLVGYNAAGKPLKIISVTDFRKAGKNKFRVKRMRIETIDPVLGKSIGATYLKFSRPKKPKK